MQEKNYENYCIAFRYGDKEYYTELESGSHFYFGGHKKDDISIPDCPAHILWAENKKGVLSFRFDGNRIDPLLNEELVLDKDKNASLFISAAADEDNTVIRLPFQGKVTFGRQTSNNVIISLPFVSKNHFCLHLENGIVHVEDLGSRNHLYLNGRLIKNDIMRGGDVLSIFTLRFLLKEGNICFQNTAGSISLLDSNIKSHDSVSLDLKSEKDESFRNSISDSYIGVNKSRIEPKVLKYRFSPRVREKMPDKPIVLSPAPAMAALGRGMRGNMAYMLSAGAMIAASMAGSVISPQLMMMRMAGLISPAVNMAAYSKMSKEEKKQFEEFEKARKESYQNYIDEQKARIQKIADVQRKIVTAENPSPESCVDFALSFNRRLWERSSIDDDFLKVRVGMGMDHLCVEVKSRDDVDSFQMDSGDDLEKLTSQIVEETRFVKNIPIQVPVRDRHIIGMIGPTRKVQYELRNIIVELTSMHSSNELRIAGLFDQKVMDVWGILRWLPHMTDESEQVRYIAFDEDSIHTVCELIEETIRQRATTEIDNNRSTQTLPHYFVIVQDRELIKNEKVNEKLISEQGVPGITTLFLGESLMDLPQMCEQIIDLNGEPCTYHRSEYNERLYFQPDPNLHHHDIESFVRRLAAIEIDRSIAEQQLPNAVTFLQGYNAETVEDLNILSRWDGSKPHESLAAPIGVKRGGELFSLDIRSGDKSHGPHGLLAGTTGSGKSELLQSWILSMAVTFHPHDVNFVIIDYKGGGMSDLLEPLPHVVGKITNIDRNITRSLISLKGELKRRQKLFADAGVNNIDKYHIAYKKGRVHERLPHLVIVTDEFAELKKEQPDFMTELNSVATIGRSLGIHMLLATQKPAGVVNDQIDSNSRFRICMKVQDVSDSREMLKRPDAARITQAGRAYIRVGENEVFDLFQSFYSAAEYTGNSDSGLEMENLVRIVGVTGNRINPLAKQKASDHSGIDQLTAVISHINDICRAENIMRLPGPWLPELPSNMYFDDIGISVDSFEEQWGKPFNGISVPVGRYDIPQIQKQGNLNIDLSKTGSYAIFGMPGTGKTIFLKSFILSLCTHYSPKDVEITAIDAGSWTLSELSGFPHMNAVILNQDTPRINSFMRDVLLEIENRKHAFVKGAVSSLEAYRESVSDTLKAHVIVIDQIGVLFEQYPEMETVVDVIVSSGAAYGIYLLFTNNLTSGIRYRILQNTKGIVSFRMSDKSEYQSLVGPITDISLPTVPGSALLKGNPPVAFQTVMYLEEENDKERHDHLVHIEEQMTAVWRKNNNDSVCINNEGEIKVFGNKLPLGSDPANLSNIAINAEGNKYCLLFTGSNDSCSKAHNAILSLLSKSSDNVIFSFDGMKDPQENREALNSLVTEMNARKKQKQVLKREPDYDENTWLSETKPAFALFQNNGFLLDGMSNEERSIILRLLSIGAGLGLMPIAFMDSDHLTEEKTKQLVNTLIKNGNGIILDGTPADYSVFQPFDVSNSIVFRPLSDNEAVLLKNGTVILFRPFWEGI